MTKKEREQIEEAQAKWADTVTEKDVIEKLQISQTTLRRMRREGKIKNFRYISVGTTGNPDRPGKKPVYSLTELTQLFSPSL